MELLVSPANTTANVSGSVALTCAAAGIPAPQVSWFQKSRPLEGGVYNISESVVNNDTSYFTTSTLVLCDLELGDTDLYSCTANNNVSRGLSGASAAFSLTVQGKGGQLFRRLTTGTLAFQVLPRSWTLPPTRRWRQSLALSDSTVQHPVFHCPQ